MTALVEIRDADLGYDGAPVIRNLNLRVEEGEIVALLGANGVGKTTTLLTLSGLVPAIGGAIRILGQTVSSRRPYRMAGLGLAHVPEDRSLFGSLSVEDNIKLGSRSRSTRAKDLDLALDYFPALRGLLRRRAGLLSGGEQQMLALGRAMMSRPKVLLIDEMSFGLAPVIVERLMPVLRRLTQEHGTGILLVEQHVHMALQTADRGYVLSHSHPVLEGTAAELLSQRDDLEASYFAG